MAANMTEKRCAVYTRKSTEDGLELKYNSLDAQYDACSAYIRSQMSEGWSLVEKRYDDGGFSGGDLRRPAVQELLKDIKADLIDVVVVYKIDRLSRSIWDFADIFKTFEEHHVSFVSVTQHIDTSNAAGRMMLNILMSFAQFEREMSADRIRDKIYSTKKKGYWVGGVVPYGYIAENKLLKIHLERSKGVAFAFKRYLELNSTFGVAKELNERHPRQDGARWTGRNVYTLLRNPIYAGIILIKRTNEKVDGVHEAIVPKETYEQVQASLDASNESTQSESKERRSVIAPLKGILHCGTCGAAMSVAYSHYRGNKNRRYVYYRCGKSARASDGKCEVEHISGEMLEKFVFCQLEDFMRKEDFVEVLCQGVSERRDVLLDRLEDVEQLWKELLVSERSSLFAILLEDVRVWADRVELTLKCDGGKKIVVPYVMRNDAGATRIIKRDDDGPSEEEQELGIAKMFRKTHAWIELLTSGVYESKRDLANALGVSGSYVSKMLRFQFFSPRIIEAIANGSRPDLSIEKLSHISSPIWEDQERQVGL